MVPSDRRRGRDEGRPCLEAVGTGQAGRERGRRKARKGSEGENQTRKGREGRRGCNGLVIRDNGCCDKVMVMKRPMGVVIT
ncbi:hypothetical protein E2C01_024561 [Portunus trituberculatus]|uniref:Uncharacterized protein n=1 Tax=Portunus trituberculatus TaxID=210409 RepID=A0A5B7EDH8_PORTR|nr:hypothetical protein [Portunus trituberculatus]